MLPMGWNWSSHVGLVACALYVLASLTSRGSFMFAVFPMFGFPVAAHGTTAVPLFLADDERADIETYDSFFEIEEHAVDATHEGTDSSVAHMYREQAAWIARHRVTAAEPGSVRCAIGSTFVSIDADAVVTTRDRITARGLCKRR
jgi:hypothetical protein